MDKIIKIIIKRKWQVSIPLLAISGLLYTIGISIFLYKAKAFPTGTGAYAQLIVYGLNFPPQYFSIFLLVFNIPFFIIFWKKIERKILLYTIIWVIFQLGWSQLLILHIFKNHNPLDVVEINKKFTSSGKLLYALAGACLSGIAIGLAFLAGGSTAGTDILVYYLYKKHKKSIGIFEILVGFTTAFSAVVIEYIIKDSNNISIFKLFFGISTFITIVYISITGIIMNLIYPRHKKVLLKISSEKIKKITAYLLESEFHHGYAIQKEHSVYSKRENEIIITVISYLEVGTLVSKIQDIDENVWISMSYIAKIFGNFEDKLLT